MVVFSYKQNQSSHECKGELNMNYEKQIIKLIKKIKDETFKKQIYSLIVAYIKRTGI